MILWFNRVCFRIWDRIWPSAGVLPRSGCTGPRPSLPAARNSRRRCCRARAATCNAGIPRLGLQIGAATDTPLGIQIVVRAAAGTRVVRVAAIGTEAHRTRELLCTVRTIDHLDRRFGAGACLAAGLLHALTLTPRTWAGYTAAALCRQPHLPYCPSSAWPTIRPTVRPSCRRYRLWRSWPYQTSVAAATYAP